MNHVGWQTRNLKNKFSLLLFVFIFLNTLFAFAGPAHTTYQAKIIKPDGLPLEANNVNFKFTILDPTATCILFAETYSAVNMTATGGVISFSLGSGVKTYPVSSTTFEQVFSNISPSLSCDAGGPGSITPAANDIRKIVMQFHDGSGWQTLPAMSINAVPYAMYATNADFLGGVSATAFVQDSDLLTCAGGQALTFNGTSFSCVAVGGGGVTSSTIATALGYTPADGASITAVTSSLSNANSTIASVSSSVFSVSSTVSSLEVAVSTLTNSVAASFAAISGSGISTLNGSTSATQSFSNVITGTQPAFVTANGLHTLNIPYASAATTTAGLISNTDYSLFSTVQGKITSSAASIAQVLGYTPADAATFTALGSNVAAVSSSLTSLTNSVAASFSTITPSQWVTSGSTISYSGDAIVSGTLVLGNTPPINGSFDFGPAHGGLSTYKAAFFLQDTLTDFSNSYTAGQISSVKLNAPGNTTSLSVGSIRHTQNVASSSANYNAGIYGSYDIVENNGTGTVGALVGISPLVLQNSPNNVTTMYGVHSRAFIYQGNVNSAFGGVFSAANFGGNVQNSYGIMIDSAGTTPVTNVYGLLVTDQSLRVASQTFNIYSSGLNSKNVFSGSVGIGLDRPTARLHLAAGTAVSGIFKLTSGTLLTSPQSGSIEYDGFNLYYTDGTNTRRTVANTSSTAVTSSSIAAALGYTPADTTIVSSLATQVTSITALVSGGTFSQWTTSGAAITFAGSVGVGVASPTAALEVGGQIAAGSAHTWLAGNIGMLPIPGNATNLGTSVLGWNASNGGGELNLINAKGPGSPGGFTFDQWDGAIRTTRMVINGSTGYVGIGTTNPAQHLDVSGTAQATKFYAGDGAFNLPSMTFANSSNTGFYNAGGNLGISVGGGLKGTWSANSLGFNAGGAGPQIYFTGGNAAQPSYAFNSDADTGMFNPNASGGSNELGFSTSGVERVRISASGAVGIGTTTPLTNLHVSGTSSYNSILISSGNYSAITAQGGSISGWPLFQLSNQAANGRNYNIEVGRHNSGSFGIHDNASNTTRLMITASGAVGIGTIVPTQHVSVENNTDADTLVNVTNNSTGASARAGFSLTNLGSGYGPYSGGILMGGVSHTSMPNQMAIFTNSGIASGINISASTGGVRFSTGASEKMRIDTVGNVGIGVSAPATSLDVNFYGAAAENIRLRGRGAGAEGGQMTVMDAIGVGAWEIDNYGVSGSERLRVFRDRGENNLTEPLAIYPTGYVAVGATIPTANLTILSANNINNGSNLASGTGAIRISDGSSIGLLFDTNQIEQMEPANYLYLNYNSAAATIINRGGGNVAIGDLLPGAKLDVSASGATMLSNGQGATIRISNPSSANADYFQVGWISEDNWGIMTADASTHRNLVVTPWGGNLGVGNTSPTYKLDVTGDIRITGTPYRNGGDSNWIVPSDARLKDVISDYNRGLREIISIDTIIFNYKKENPKQIDSSVKYTGVLAQQVQKQIPEAVAVDKDGFLSLNTGPIFWAMINAIKEVYQEVMGIKAENAQLRTIATEQARKIQSLEEENAVVKARLERIEKALEKAK